MRHNRQILGMVLGMFLATGAAEAQYYGHSDFGGYTYSSPFRNSSFSYRYDTGSLYVRKGALSNTYSPDGAAGLLPTGPTLRPTATGLAGPSISSLGPTLSLGTSRSPWIPTVRTGLPSSNLGTPAKPIAPSSLSAPSIPLPPPRPAVSDVPSRPGLAGPQAESYTPYLDQAWTAQRRFYRVNR